MNSANTFLVREIKKLFPKESIAFVSGNFNIVHPGHLRLFDFAAGCADILVVGVHRQHSHDTVIPEEFRLEGVKKITGVDFAVLLPCDPEEFVSDLQPQVVVKGKEHEDKFNPESEVLESYGGKLLFSSGEVRFSSLDLLRREIDEEADSDLVSVDGYFARHQLHVSGLMEIIGKFNTLKIVVIGDLIIDEYIACEALGMSQEDPTLVVSPLKYDRFVGGAGIVAAHARGLGASVSYFGVVGKDDVADFAREKLVEYGVKECLLEDDGRPTTLKQRFRASGKTLLRVSHLRQHDISGKLVDTIYSRIIKELDEADLLIFSDFNYGCLPQLLVDRITDFCKIRRIMMVADSQASSQIGDVSRFQGMNLITPTEREARLASHDHNSGLVVLADRLREKSHIENIIITLGAEGILIHAPHTTRDSLITDRIPALNSAPQDVAGAGDSLLTASSMALAVGASIWQASYLGSLAAACQVRRIGNHPLKAENIIKELSS
ncbi:PfkB family carbohydrate kinase [Thalassospira alkalitolerans]|uniref:ADP-heptose synthase n=1 Tax=Thalassospira alkalitolerans TaxID=1293890 RepID=A0A1Y2LFH9_9PROT|nr:PfkB family carbohydrate kinase [Thalassospira alkalitolerans]OSQ50079.1 ADP-heptose synthase [Thalassospira alkalitolerans]